MTDILKPADDPIRRLAEAAHDASKHWKISAGRSAPMSGMSVLMSRVDEALAAVEQAGPAQASAPIPPAVREAMLEAANLLTCTNSGEQGLAMAVRLRELAG